MLIFTVYVCESILKLWTRLLCLVRKWPGQCANPGLRTSPEIRLTERRKLLLIDFASVDRGRSLNIERRRSTLLWKRKELHGCRCFLIKRGR